MVTYLVEYDISGDALAKFADHKILHLRINDMELVVPANHENLV